MGQKSGEYKRDWTVISSEKVIRTLMLAHVTRSAGVLTLLRPCIHIGWNESGLNRYLLREFQMCKCVTLFNTIIPIVDLLKIGVCGVEYMHVEAMYP